MQRDVATPADYLAAVPAEQLPLVEHLRALVQEAAPDAREEICWGMLSYDENGGLFGIAAQKHYVSLYVMATQALKDMAAELAALDHGKCCLRFKRLTAIRTDTLRKLLAHAVTLHERECRKQP